MDWARRRLCGQASSATSEHAFSKTGLIVSKKRKRLTADTMDGIRFARMALQRQWLGRISKETSVCSIGER